MLLEICSQPTDDDIREMLEKPPTTLTQLYCLILSRTAAIGRSKEAISCFSLLAATKRPLTVDELQEVMAVEPYSRASQPGRFINDFMQIFTWFGGLLIREEINNEVRFAHSTVLQAISDPRQISSQQWAHIDIHRADVHMGIICTTYLHFDDFKTQLVKRSGLQNINSKTMLTASLKATMPLLAKFLQSTPSPRKSRPELSIGVANRLVDATPSSADVSGVTNSGVGHHPFLEYASLHWLSHSRYFTNSDRIWPLWEALLSEDHQLAKKPPGLTQNSSDLMNEIYREWHFALFQWDLLGKKLISDDDARDILTRACNLRATKFLTCFFNNWAELNLDPDMVDKIVYDIIKRREKDLAEAIVNSSFADSATTSSSVRSNHERVIILPPSFYELKSLVRKS
jgi:hypothetical protein